jgi:hypothetical protein
MSSLQFCTDTLIAYGASESETLELLNYNQNIFDPSLLAHPDEPQPELYLATWAEYVWEATRIGAYAALKPHLVQFQFPILAGISTTAEYRAATRKGESTVAMPTAVGLTLLEPERLQLYVHKTCAGDIPVLVAGNRTDFVSLVRALIERNEPESIPDSMGACIVGGYNNWHRVRQYQQQWLEENADRDWAVEFQSLIKRPELYQDRFILLSRGAYSNVAASELGLEEGEWLELSGKIRLEHECTHYITRRWFGSMRNNILDEIIADYWGIVAACGKYRSDWFLRFVGLEDFPAYRAGGRLENYRGDPPLSSGAFIVLQRLVKAAAENLARFDRKFTHSGRTRQTEIAILIALITLRLEELASEGGVSLIEAATTRFSPVYEQKHQVGTKEIVECFPM